MKFLEIKYKETACRTVFTNVQMESIKRGNSDSELFFREKDGVEMVEEMRKNFSDKKVDEILERVRRVLDNYFLII